MTSQFCYVILFCALNQLPKKLGVRKFSNIAYVFEIDIVESSCLKEIGIRIDFVI